MLDADYPERLRTHIQHLIRCNEMLLEMALPLSQKFPHVDSVRRLVYITQNVNDATVEILTDMQQLSLASMELTSIMLSLRSSGSAPLQPL